MSQDFEAMYKSLEQQFEQFKVLIFIFTVQNESNQQLSDNASYIKGLEELNQDV